MAPNGKKATPKFDVAKGHRDWYGANAILRNHIRGTLGTVFERYGYQPIETPLVEDQAAIGFKGGGEIQKEVYTLSDNGKRDLALRFDQTVPLARFMATHLGEISLPFKRYAIGPVFRDGPTQPDQGRYRSFTQCDVDVLGLPSMAAEAELLALAQDAFSTLGLGGVEASVNNRKLLDGILECAGVPDGSKLRTIVTLDKLDKMEGKLPELKETLTKLTLADGDVMISQETLDKLFDLYDNKTPEIALSRCHSAIVEEVGQVGYAAIEEVFKQNAGRTATYADVSSFKTKGDLLLEPAMVNRLMEIVSAEGSNDDIFRYLSQKIASDRGQEGLREIGEVLGYSKSMGIDFVRFNPALARGLDYYTGTTLEVFLKNREIVNSAILAGGRFDNMVGDFCGGEEIPAVGFSFGLERLAMVLAGQNSNLPSTTVQVYLVPTEGADVTRYT